MLAHDRPQLMGIVNVTPDSFSDGGHFFFPNAAITHAKRLIDEGANWLDIGGESSRPGAAPLPEDQELARVLPVLTACTAFGKPISIDTYKPAVMRAAIAHGAAMINDIWGFRQPGAIEAVAASTVRLCVMHMQRDPQTMQREPHYDDVVREVGDFFAERIAALEAADVARSRIVLDPGFGFGKTFAHNVALLQGLESFARFGCALLVGVSRKSMIAQMLSSASAADSVERIHGSLAAALFAAERGATILRVHDVAATRAGLDVWHRLAND